MTDAIPDSLFLRLAEPSRYNNYSQQRGNPRASDKQVHYTQNPVGWLFFSTPHLDQLLRALDSELPGIRLDDITSEMVRIYDTYARDTYQDPSDSAAISALLSEMDVALVKRVQAIAQRFATGRTYYSNYLQTPNRPVSVPQNAASMHNLRSTEINPSDRAVQGGNFDASLSNVMAAIGKVSLPTTKPLSHYA